MLRHCGFGYGSSERAAETTGESCEGLSVACVPMRYIPGLTLSALSHSADELDQIRRGHIAGGNGVKKTLLMSTSGSERPCALPSASRSKPQTSKAVYVHLKL